MTRRPRPSGRGAESTAPGLKMKDLTAACGLPKSTILHYVREGLLPEPTRTQPNMAYYDPGCPERIAFIKMLQTRHRLPLAAIKRVLKARDKGLDVTPILELQETLFGLDDARTLDRQRFCGRTGLSEEQVEACLAERLLMPLEPGRFDRTDAAVGRILARGLELGVRPEDVDFYPRLAEEIVDREMAVRGRLTADLSVEDDAAATLDLTRMARALRAYVIDRVFQIRIMHMKGLKDRDRP